VMPRLKVRRFTQAESELRDLLAKYWFSIPNGAQRVEKVLDDEVAMRHEVYQAADQGAKSMIGTARWKSWPAKEDVLLDMTAKIALQAWRTAQEETAEVRKLLRSARGPMSTDASDLQTREAAELGALLVNAPELADWLGGEAQRLAEIAKARKRLMKEREKLAPGTTPLAEPKAVIGRAKAQVNVLWYQWNGSRLPLKQALCHAPSAVLRADLTSPCSVLNDSFEELRRSEVSPAKRWKISNRLTAKAKEKLGVVDGKVLRHVCRDCEPEINSLLASQLKAIASPRLGWHVDLESKSWRCDAHDFVICDDCQSAL
jgi:hypothetical protein